MCDYDIFVTRHGRQRIKQRTGVGKSHEKTDRIAQNAYERGICYDDTKGKLKKYINHVYRNGRSNNIRIYSGRIWLFKECNLITVMTLPTEFQMRLNDYIIGGDK